MARTYSDETKAAVIADWLVGDSLNVLAGRYDVPKTTVRTWVQGLQRGGSEPKKQTLDELVNELLIETLRGLIAIARKAQDEAWLDKQESNGLHLLYGVTADKVIRVLGAIERGSDDSRNLSAGTPEGQVVAG